MPFTQLSKGIKFAVGATTIEVGSGEDVQARLSYIPAPCGVGVKEEARSARYDILSTKNHDFFPTTRIEAKIKPNYTKSKDKGFS